MKELNYQLLGLILFLSILTADLTGTLIKMGFTAIGVAWAAVEMERTAKAAQDEITKAQTKIMQAETESLKRARQIPGVQNDYQQQVIEMQKKQALINEQARREQENREYIQKTNMETCQFWINKYNQERNDYNKSFKMTACEKVGIY